MNEGSLASYTHLVAVTNQSASLEDRTRSYLDANCAQCHVEAGGGNAQFQVNWSTPLEKMKLLDVKPLHHAFDLANPRLVAPGARIREAGGGMPIRDQEYQESMIRDQQTRALGVVPSNRINATLMPDT